jgi:hypothetical protein
MMSTPAHVPVNVMMELIVDVPRTGIYASETEEALVDSVVADLLFRLKEYLETEFVSDSGRVSVSLISVTK